MNQIHRLFCLFAVLCTFALSGCVSGTSTGSTAAPIVGQQITAQLTPAKLAKGVQDVLAAVGAGVLAKNPTYSGDVAAAADVFTAIATSNPASLTPADVLQALSKSKVSSAAQQEIATYVGAALALYESDFKVDFPALQPNYALFATAIANGLNAASSNASKIVPLPSS